MSKAQRGWLVALAALAALVYTFHGSSAQGAELEIIVDFWGLVVFVLLLVFGIRWARRGDSGESS